MVATESNLMVVRPDAVQGILNGDRQAIVQFIDEKKELIRRNLAPKASAMEFEMWIEECKFRALNPMARHIYLLPIGGKHVTQVAIDGLRLIAARTGEYAGCDDIIYDVLDADHPNRATATVYRFVQGVRVPFTASVFWKERAKQTETWRGQPYHMLGKCAMAAALRSGFPEECSGLFTDDEMVDASPYTDREIRTGPPPAPPVPRPQVGGSSRRQMREMASRMDTQDAPIKAKVTPAYAPEPHTEDEPADEPIDRDALLAELREMAAHGFDLERYLQRKHPDVDLTELSDAELMQAAEIGQNVAKKQ